MIPRVSTGSLVLFFVSSFCNANGRLAPDFIHPCNETRECLIKSVQDAIPAFVKGIPELGVLPLDPFAVDDLPIKLQGVTVRFYKGHLSGFKTCIADDVVSDVKKRYFKFEFHCNITVKGLYEAKGNLLLFPIDGAGDAKIKLTNLRMKLDINTKYVKDDKGVDHVDIKSYKYSFDYGDKVTFDLKNLFKESKALSDTVLAFLNDNWRLVSEEFGKPIMDYAVELAINTIIKFFHVVPYDELVLVPLPE